MGLFTIYKCIEKELERGVSRTEVFDKYSAKTPTDTPKVAYMLASIPYQELRQKYLKLNAFLFLLLLSLPFLNVAAEWPIDFREPTLFIAIKTLVPLILSYFVFHFHGGIYRILGLWCLIDLLESLLLLSFTTGAGFAKVVLLFLIVAICLIFSKKVFPNLKALGPRQDRQGRYLL
jgi:hypothetical protein